jgi:hypothetical protein
LIIISVLVLGRILEKLLALTSVEGSNLAWIGKSHCLAGGLSCVFCCSFPWGQFSPSLLVISQSCPLLIPKWLQGEWFKAKTDAKMEAGMPSVTLAFSLFVGLNKEVVLFSNSSLGT